MIKRIPTLLLILCSLQVLAQTPLNQWIDYGETYYKIKVAEDGLYRIDYDLLQSLNISARGDEFQLYHEGKEVPIHVSNAGVFGAGDYIEFYGEKNDGDLDRFLYEEELWQPQPRYNLFSDTAAYFLRWQEGGNPLRYEQTDFNLNEAPLADAYFMEEVYIENLDDFYKGAPLIHNEQFYYGADFGLGEGFIGKAVEATQSEKYDIQLTHPYTQIGVQAEVSARIVGLSDVPDYPNEHHFKMFVNGDVQLDRAAEGYYINDYDFNFSSTVLIQNNNTLKLEFRSMGDKVDLDVNAVCNLSVRYPRRFDFDGTSYRYFQLANDRAVNIEISNFNVTGDLVLYDITNNRRFTPVFLANRLKAFLPEGDGEERIREVVLVNTSVESSLRRIEQMEKRNFIDYSQASFEAENIIITNSKLLQNGGQASLDQYLQHRQTFVGGQINLHTIDIQELYDQFAWGVDLHPLAIRNFINMISEQWAQPPSSVLLLGNGVNYELSKNSAAAYRKAILPTWGDFPSDSWMISDKTNDATITVGRIPIREASDFADYINKLIIYDQSYRNVFCNLDNQWRKKVIMLAGADNSADLLEFKNYLGSYNDYLTGKGFGGVISSYENEGAQAKPLPKLLKSINEGVGIINYFGSSRNGGLWNIDVQDVDTLENRGAYPLIIASTCCLEEVYKGTKDPSFAAKIVMEEGKGAIGYVGSSGFDNPEVLSQWNDQFYQELLSGNNYGNTVGEALLQTRKNLKIKEENAPLNRLLQQSINFLGDPLLVPSPRSTPELITDRANVRFYDNNRRRLTGSPLKVNFEVPYFEIETVVYNIGKAMEGTFSMEVSRWLPSGEIITVAQKRVMIPDYKDTVSIQVPNDIPGASGTNSFILFLDSEAEVQEFCESDNSVTESLEVFTFCNNPPTLDLGGDTLYLSQASLILQNQATGNYTYNWSTGETSPQIEITQPGTYRVTVTDPVADCRARGQVVVSFPVGSNEQAPANYYLYPNPSTDHLQIEGLQQAEATIYDLQGKIIQQHQWKEGRTHINIQALPRGIYLLEIHHKEGVIQEKLIKQ